MKPPDLHWSKHLKVKDGPRRAIIIIGSAMNFIMTENSELLRQVSEEAAAAMEHIALFLELLWRHKTTIFIHGITIPGKIGIRKNGTNKRPTRIILRKDICIRYQITNQAILSSRAMGNFTTVGK